MESLLKRSEESSGVFLRSFSISTANARYFRTFDSENLACPRADLRCTACKLHFHCKETTQTSCNWECQRFLTDLNKNIIRLETQHVPHLLSKLSVWHRITLSCTNQDHKVRHPPGTPRFLVRHWAEGTHWRDVCLVAGVGFVSAHVDMVIPHTRWFLISLVLHTDEDEFAIRL